MNETTLWAVIVVLAVAVGYFAFVKRFEPVAYQTPTPTATVVKTTSPTVKPMITLKTYTSQALNISFKYPSDWTVKEGNNYPGSAQGNDELKITKNSDLIYASAKRDCLENYTYCKSIIDSQYPYGWPFFSTQSSNPEIKSVIDEIIKTVVRLK